MHPNRFARWSQPQDVIAYPKSGTSTGNKLAEYIKAFNTLSHQFAKRDLTYAEDGCNAFAGIASTLCRGFTGGFVSGLPVACFELALLYRSVYEERDHQIRRVSVLGVSKAAPLTKAAQIWLRHDNQ